MILIDPQKLMVNDVVLVKRLLKNDMNFLLGRVTKTDYTHKKEIHIVIWSDWREERRHASVDEFPVFSVHINMEESGLQIYRIGRWMNGEVKTRESEACYILEKMTLEVKTTGLVFVDTIVETEKFLRGQVTK
jgi:hypothetical protein